MRIQRIEFVSVCDAPTYSHQCADGSSYAFGVPFGHNVSTYLYIFFFFFLDIVVKLNNEYSILVRYVEILERLRTFKPFKTHHQYTKKMADNSGTNESTGSGSSGSTGSSSNTEGNAGQQTGGSVLTFMLSKKIESALWITRIFTIVCTFLFFFPIVGGGPYGFYQRALISNAATSALRLHQRLPNFQLNRQFLSLLLAEDSCHYLIYSLMFMNSYPLTMSLIPICLYAVLHACNFTVQILNVMGPQSIQFVRNMITKLQAQQVSILRFIACTEIFIMPAVFLMTFTTLFHELRVTIEYLCNKPQCPAMVRNMLTKIIAFISRLAPTYSDTASNINRRQHSDTARNIHRRQISRCQYSDTTGNINKCLTSKCQHNDTTRNINILEISRCQEIEITRNINKLQTSTRQYSDKTMNMHRHQTSRCQHSDTTRNIKHIRYPNVSTVTQLGTYKDIRYTDVGQCNN
ncbi:TMEM33 [Mytilus coruscus]|uniref:TMEM33 n=1 Tax=Mytilus coruscus TaxID=42192 RepID=A0A6J8CLE8_MYTCO|nr:TMEM33 [Mytilus coruscus]